jgi:hypothetical protein
MTRHLAIVAKSQPDMIRHDVLQMREALMVENMARDLVDRVIWQSFEDTDRRIQARVRQSLRGDPAGGALRRAGDDPRPCGAGGVSGGDGGVIPHDAW